MRAVKGFSLLEVILTIAFVGVGVAGIISVLPTLFKSSLLADQSIVASNLARETMEKIIALRDCSQTNCGYAYTLAHINDFDQTTVSGFAGYSIDASAYEVDPDSDGTTDDFLDALAGSNYARVTVQVSWNSGANSVQLVTLLANY